MTKRLQVLLAVKDMIQAALPSIEVFGLENEGVAPDRIGPAGRVVIRSGDPGDPEVTLSPVSYDYDHQIPIEIAAYGDAARSAEEALDAIVAAIGLAIAADRTAGGAIDYLDATAPSTADVFAIGATPARFADTVLIASYSTTLPL